MGKNKLARFAEIAEFDHVLELTDFQDGLQKKPKGRWKSDIFENNNPVILELACGKGTYTLELARRNSNINVIGIDIKGGRIWKGAKQARDCELSNVRFLRIYIDHLHEYFATGEVDEIWITFPDPYLRASNRSKRLTSPKFLNIYQKVLKANGSVRLKTDSDPLFSYTKRVTEEVGCQITDLVENIYSERPDDELLTIKTDYEKKHLAEGRTISFIEFKLPRHQE